MLIWQILKKRVAVKMELQKRGLISLESSFCAFCRKEMETVEHLFFSCSCSWVVWMACCRLWNISWAAPKDPTQFFLSWIFSIRDIENAKVWKMAFYAIVWSIWLHRNEVVFNQKQFDAIQLFEIVKLRLMWWAKAAWPNVIGDPLDFFRCPNFAMVTKSKIMEPRCKSWECPTMGFMKFNVDGASRGKPGHAGIGGLLRDDKGKVWMEFSKSIGISESNEAEICAIREAILMFCASRWVATHGLIIESDSKNAVKWIECPEEVPWRLRKWVSHIGLLLKNCSSYRVVHVFREANREADKLAKEGVDRSVAFIRALV